MGADDYLRRTTGFRRQGMGVPVTDRFLTKEGKKSSSLRLYNIWPERGKQYWEGVQLLVTVLTNSMIEDHAIGVAL